MAGRISIALIRCQCNKGTKEGRIKRVSVSDLVVALKLLMVWVATGKPGIQAPMAVSLHLMNTSMEPSDVSS